MKRPPRSVPICGVTWKVRHKRMRADNGYIDDNQKTIWIASGMDVQAEWETFLHECLHAMEFATEGNRAVAATASRCRHARAPRGDSPADAYYHDLIERIDTPLFAMLRDVWGVGK